jgi:two-component system, OmpR family, sensor histidine kinase TctE
LTVRPAPVRQSSLFGEILDWMLAPLLLIWPMSVALTWLVAQGIATRPYDRELAALAQALAQEVSTAYDEHAVRRAALGPRLSRTAALLLRTEDEQELIFQILGPRGELVAGDSTLPVPATAPSDNAVQFRDEELRDQELRVAVVRAPLGRGDSGAFAVVQIAETLDRRKALATEIIKGVILPQFVILPIAVLLVWLALNRAIRPLHRLQQRIRRRPSDDLSPIPVQEVPEEVVPLVGAINDLLQRLDRSLAMQRQFLADAAHQLKTPLAGLRMQAELAEREVDQGRNGAVRHSLQQIALSSDRAAHMVNQLLSMARAENQGSSQKAEHVDLAALTIEVVREFVPRALARGIDIGYEGPDPGAGAPGFRGLPVLVREVVRNLVDNALLYTPRDGTVTARVYHDTDRPGAVLQVEDSGPGIPEAERERVFQPFYRALGTNVDGSGLGLAIVREIVDRHGAQLVLDTAHAEPLGDGQGPGARFTIRFPALMPPRGAPLPAEP